MRIITITSPDLSNGLGCRVTVWCAGCSHHCEGCHNKHTWKYDIGTDISIKENFDKIYNILDEELSKEYINGITFSGGDPLDQTEESLIQLYDLIVKLKEKHQTKNIWIYSGATFESLISNNIKRLVLSVCDVLVDGLFIKELHNEELAFKGSSNQRIIDLNKTIENGKIVELKLK